MDYPKRLENHSSNYPLSAKLLAISKRFLRTLGEIIYGATIYEMVRDLEKERASLEKMFVLIVFGDLFGIPVLPPYYTLRILPFVIPIMPGLKRSILRERDLTDMCDQDFT